MSLTQQIRQIQQENPHTEQACVAILLRNNFDGQCGAAELRFLFKYLREHCKNQAKVLALTVIEQIVRDNPAALPFWPNLNPKLLCYQLAIRILEPRTVAQGAYGLCGPAALAVLMAKTKPIEYATLAYELVRYGRCKFAGMTVEPSEAIRTHTPSHETPQADWLVLASIRNSSDKLAEETGKYGGTTFSEMIAWLRQAGYRTILGATVGDPSGFFDSVGVSLASKFGLFTNYFQPSRPGWLYAPGKTTGDQKANLAAAKLCADRGYKVFLMVSEKYTQATGANNPVELAVNRAREAYVLTGTPENPVLIDKARTDAIRQFVGDKSNHWALTKAIDYDPAAVNGDFRIQRYSWGTKDWTVRVPVDLFLKCYGGFIAVSDLPPT